MNIKKTIAIFLGLIGISILAWGLFNLLVEQDIYTGPTPMVLLVVIPLLLKAYQMYRRS